MERKVVLSIGKKETGKHESTERKHLDGLTCVVDLQSWRSQE